MTNKHSSPNDTVKNTENALRKAIKAALERKRKLGQYSVMWRNNQVITEGDDAPPASKG